MFAPFVTVVKLRSVCNAPAYRIIWTEFREVVDSWFFIKWIAPIVVISPSATNGMNIAINPYNLIGYVFYYDIPINLM